MNGFCFASATDLARAVRREEVSPVAVTERYLDRIAGRNDERRAYVTVVADEARERAREIEAAVATGEEVGPLAGVPVGIKDLFALRAGTRHTFGSELFADFVPDRSAPVVERLEAAGAVVLGKTNAPEFGNRPTTDNAILGTTTTPFGEGLTAGGTSGGSAAAVADGMAALAQGSDAGGSVRIPAACCGVVGLKPSFGRVPNGSRPNAFAEHTPFTQHGPLARTVADAALFLDVTAGPHPADPHTLPAGGRYRDALDRDVSGWSVAWSPDLDLVPVDPDVRERVRETLDALAAAGASVERVTLDYDHDPGTVKDAWRTFFQVLIADVGETLADEYGVDLDDDRVDALFKRVHEAGERHSALDVRRADRVRTDVFDAVQSVLAEHDLLATPTLSVTPFDATEYGPTEIDGREADPFVDWLLTWPFNMTDHPAISVPAGPVSGLPTGLQFVGRRHADGDVLAAAAAVEADHPWHDAYPGAGAGVR
ncbi:MAG: amidase [Haloarculaceae archaeon]